MARSIVSPAQLESIAEAYRRRWGIEVCAADVEGRLLSGCAACRGGDDDACRRARRDAVAEAARWGEPTVVFCPRKHLIWAAPIMHNARVLGGVIAHASERRIFPAASGAAAIDVRLAAADLRGLLEQANLTNADFLAARRQEYRRQQLRAEGLHLAKQAAPDVRRLYVRHEPALMAAIRRDDRPAARGLLNEILTAIVYAAGGRIDLTKSFFLELVAMMGRTAVEAGAPGTKLLTVTATAMAELAAIADEQALAGWLHQTLEQVLDAIAATAVRSDRAIAAALHFMADHLEEDLPRDRVSEAVGLSGGYFSRRFAAEMGEPFNAALRRMRLDRAAELLVRTDLPLAEVALACGLPDQSYFTRVFREARGLTPGQHRARYRRGP